MNKKIDTKRIIYLCVILILVLIMIYSGLRILESTVFSNNQETVTSLKTITRDGVDYFPRQDITVVLVTGIDQYGPVKSSNSYNNEGTADMVMLMIFDEKNENCNIMYLNRDTMLEMPVLGIGGRQAGTYYGQLALSHTYGSGLEDSCENVKNTVSDFLDGITIDHYVSMNMDAIAILNDAVGGVAVTVTDDFSDVDPTITKGTITLRGEQALNYVRTRKDVGDQLNLSRMKRQQEYVDSFVGAFRAKMEDGEEFIFSTYEELSPYIVSDCSVNVISGMLDRYQDYTLNEVFTPEGENVLGEEYYEFYADEEKLSELILHLFYAPK